MKITIETHNAKLSRTIDEYEGIFEVLEAMVYLLLGVSYHPHTIIDGFTEMADRLLTNYPPSIND